MGHAWPCSATLSRMLATMFRQHYRHLMPASHCNLKVGKIATGAAAYARRPMFIGSQTIVGCPQGCVNDGSRS